MIVLNGPIFIRNNTNFNTIESSLSLIYSSIEVSSNDIRQMLMAKFRSNILLTEGTTFNVSYNTVYIVVVQERMYNSESNSSLPFFINEFFLWDINFIGCIEN